MLKVVSSPPLFSGSNGRKTNAALDARWNSIIRPTEPPLALKTDVIRTLPASTKTPNSQNGVSSGTPVSMSDGG